MPCIVCNQNLFPTKTITFYEYSLSFHPSCMSFGNISNYNKLGTQKTNGNVIRIIIGTQNFTIRKKSQRMIKLFHLLSIRLT